ncbi:MAG: zf-HC2 domain-containing protein [Bryobacteraceae bacterium]
MSCNWVQRTLSAYAGGVVSNREKAKIEGHLVECADCAARAERMFPVRSALRALPARRVPAHLTTALRVLASRERVRRLRWATLGSLAAAWISTARLWLDNIMRPVALPIAGGVASAVILFSIMTPVFTPPGNGIADDVPTILSTEASFIRMGPFSTLNDEDIVVVLTVDGNGRMIDYSTPSGQRWVNDPEIRKSIENALLFTIFTPGTTFGKPAYGKVRVTFRRSAIDVRG